jgi:hypothetical protein
LADESFRTSATTDGVEVALCAKAELTTEEMPRTAMTKIAALIP